MLTYTIEIRQDQQDQYLTVPFEMPPGIARLEVSYTYAGHGEGDCVIDLGILESDRPRGWSGGARPSFFIAAAQATPGYQAGPLTPGHWAVLLGTYRIPPGGATCTVTIRFEPASHRWLKGDLHHHTHHSDGAHSVAEVLQLAEEAGLDFIALTDHNTITQNQVRCESPVLTIPGLEVTTNHGHLNILGARELVDFRFRHAAEFRRPAAGLVVLNHPHCDFCPWEHDFGFDFDLVEVWNGLWTGRNERALAWWQAELAAGRRLPAVGGSDCHRVELFSVVRTGAPTTYVLAEDATVEAILAGLKQGHVMISDMQDGPAIWLTPCPGEIVAPGTHEVALKLERAEDCTLRLVDRTGIIYEAPAADFTYAWEATTGNFLRAELRSDFTGMVRALTNPIYVG
ncbi:MAG: phosphoesterase domain protein [Symbiobacteriaceae bacterium]|nr:phosphoesterase domain protein [Symbiobacteriaceae bacterium]